MNEEQIIYYILITLMPDLGPISRNRLLSLCGNINNCFSISADELCLRDSTQKKHGRIGEKKIRSFIASRNEAEYRARAEKIYRTCEDKNIVVIPKCDCRYPEKFPASEDMPVVIYAAGALRINEFQRTIGIIGARRCTPEGKENAIDLAQSATDNGIPIISGMAKGIDSYSHTAALKAGGYTIAVLGSGPDICYPKEHQRLYEEIILHGTVISEYPPGTPPHHYMFPQRNRLIAALSDDLYVIDTGRHSGTNSTVEFGMKYNRRIFFWP